MPKSDQKTHPLKKKIQQNIELKTQRKQQQQQQQQEKTTGFLKYGDHSNIMIYGYQIYVM